MAPALSLRADCARCAALCCVGLYLDRSAAFGADKAAGEPCPHSSASGCSIHENRLALGYAGCVAYDCLGAGQRVTELFAGRTWRTEPALLASMLDAFFLMRRLHEGLELLELARRLPLSDEQRRHWGAAWGELVAAHEATLAELERIDFDAIHARLTTFLESLRPLVIQGGGRRRLPLAQPRKMLTPPSTSSALPVTKLDASDTR